MTPISRSSLVSVVSGLVDIGAQQDIITDRARLQTRQGHRNGQLLDEPRPFAGQLGRHEEADLVDEVGPKERGGQRRPTLEQERLNTLRRKRAQLLLEIARTKLELRPLRQRPP